MKYFLSVLYNITEILKIKLFLYVSNFSNFNTKAVPYSSLFMNVEWLNIRKMSKRLSLHCQFSTNFELEFKNIGYNLRSFITHCKGWKTHIFTNVESLNVRQILRLLQGAA